MPITRLDIMTTPPKTQEATHIKHAENQKHSNEQQLISNQFSQNVQHNNQKTVRMTKSENKEQRYDAKEKGNGEYSGNSNKKKKDQQKEKIFDKDPFLGSGFDMKF